MADPFGLAYGIGAGMANVPGAFQQGKEDTIRLAMAQLAMQQAQKQQAMEDATNEVMSREYADPAQAPQAPVEPSVAISGGGTNADGTIAPRSAMPRGFDPMNPMATSQDVANDPTAAQRGIAPKTIKPLANPNVITAHKMLLQSEALQKIGNWRVAQQLRDHAMTYGEKGMKEVRQQFGQMVAGGMFDQAVSALHGMGIQNVVGITPSEDGMSVVLHKDDGTSFDMDDEALAKFINPDATAKSAQELLLKREALAIKREELNRKVNQGDRGLTERERHNRALEDRLRFNAIHGATSTPAKMQIQKAIKASILASAKQRGEAMTDVDAEALAWKQANMGVRAYDDMSMKAAEKIYAQLAKNPPMDGDDLYPMWQKALEIMGNALVQKPSQPKTGTIPPPPGNANILK